MKLETNLEKIQWLAEVHDEENWQFRRFLKQCDHEEIDEIVHRPKLLVDTSSQIQDVPNIFQSLTGKSETKEDQNTIVRSATGKTALTGRTLLERLSYTHLELLAALDDPLKRSFYNWNASRATGRCVNSNARLEACTLNAQDSPATRKNCPKWQMPPHCKPNLPKSSTTPMSSSSSDCVLRKYCPKVIWKMHCSENYRISLSNSVMASALKRDKNDCSLAMSIFS